MERILNTDSEGKEKTGIYLLIAAGILAVVLFLFPPVRFELKGEDPYYSNYGSAYRDPGYKLTLFGVFDITGSVQSFPDVNVNEPGEYSVLYTYRFGMESGYAKRKVIVEDIMGPEISSSNPGVLTGYLGYAVELPSYEAFDYVDGDCSETIETGDHDPYYYGYQYIPIKAVDEKGNESTYMQPVVVVDYGMSMSDVLPAGIFEMRIEEEKVRLVGYIPDARNGEEMTARLAGPSILEGELTQLDTYRLGYVSVVFDVKNLKNGTYTLEFAQGRKVTKPRGVFVSGTQKLSRMKAGEKFLTWNYEDGITVQSEDFAYDYDILIDVGHGGSDPGAIAYDGTKESYINLQVSLYEKQRYEEHGLKVKLLREENDYPELLGDDSWETLTKEFWTFAWYSPKARFAYSNHHNADGSRTARGPEIILNPYMTNENYPVPFRIAAELQDVFPEINTRWLLSTKNYNNGRRLDMAGGKSYPDVRMWYGIQRIPYESCGKDTVTYEGAYISSPDDLEWYWTEENWKKVSEVKIRAYVEALGKEYIPPKEGE
ncbi:MAG: N-acetylmuramoyl-L-alanine amidase [Erysipelotrichales bacterium]|nr:N-acetylmuramoyl-L-alanine amidase [Erysipelotrichales bacterium]MBQ5542371.1 N-acetylmuramoyl-L-alanine amidase [Erysipelotrichales bacterium]